MAADHFLDQSLGVFGTIWETLRTFSPDDDDELEEALREFAVGWKAIVRTLKNDGASRIRLYALT